MDLEIKPLTEKYINECIYFATKGMHFDSYLHNKTMCFLYGKYFLYDELLHSTQIIAVYDKDDLLGILLAKMKGERRVYKSFWKKLYVKVFSFLNKNLSSSERDPYDSANKEMLNNYKEKENLDGEICFLASDPDHEVDGVGTMLLEELERREKGKTVYLFTDNLCTYQFYEHRGFIKADQKDIFLDMEGDDDINMSCFLYVKKIK